MWPEAAGESPALDLGRLAHVAPCGKQALLPLPCPPALEEGTGWALLWLMGL